MQTFFKKICLFVVLLSLLPYLIAAVTTIVSRKQIPVVFKNLIINGDGVIAQRGTTAGASTYTVTQTFTSVANDAYTVDRWIYQKGGIVIHTISQSPDVPTVAQAGRLINNSIRLAVTTADGSIGSADFCSLSQKIEGFRWVSGAQIPLTLSFWVRDAVTGTHCVTLINSGGDKNLLQTYTINAADTWEFKTVKCVASPSAGTWDYTNGVGVKLVFTLSGGTNFQGTPDSAAYGSGSLFSSNTQVNSTSATSNIFAICGVQLERGNIATDYENRIITEDALLCERYFKILDQSNASFVRAWCMPNNSQDEDIYTSFTTQMRAAPSGSKNGTWGVTNCGQPSIVGTATFGFDTRCRNTTADIATTFFMNSSDDNLTFEAEL